jgi:transcriptional regulator with PAS, ATPase and Fis domain
MKAKSTNSIKEQDLKLKRIDALLHEKRFKEALAEIRDLEVTQKWDESSSVFGHFCYYSAEVFRRLGNYHTALNRAVKAFEIFRNTNENKRIAQIKYTLGNIHIALGDMKTAQDELQDSLTTYKRIDDDHGRISVLFMLSNVFFQQGVYQRAVEYLHNGIELCDKIENRHVKARGLSNLGRIYILLGKWQFAQNNLLSAAKIFEEKSDKLCLCQALLSLGYVFYLQRYFEKAKRHLEKALRLIYANNYTREMAIYYEYYGELAFAQGNYFLAKDHYKNGIKIGEEIAPSGDIVSQIHRLLAEVQIAEKEYDQALVSCEKALKVATSLGERIEIGAIHRALGQIHTAKSAGVVGELARHELTRAKENFDKSISILEQIGAKYELGKAYLEALKSNAFEYVDRVSHYVRGREIFKELGSDYHVAIITLAFCEFLHESGEYEKAEAHLKDPEKILERLNEKKDLGSLLKLKSGIEKALGKVGAPGDRHRAEYSFSDVVTRNPQMLALLEQARKFKDAEVPILLEGETGTGKDLVAKVIHCESKRKDRRFVKVSCAAIPETLLESELFGYKKGAFSGADRDKKGLLEEADGGTILLNEIGDLPLRLQAKILDVIEDREMTRLGEVRPHKVDFRVIAATNKSLSQEVEKGAFRQDLYHRLNVVILRLPPLREREGDIPLLIEHFLAKKDLPLNIEQLDIEHLLKYHWPGNIRELENEFRRYASVAELMEGLSRWDKGGDDSVSGKLIEMEKRQIIEAVRRAKGKQEAAELLGISLSTLYRKIKLYGLDL